MKKLFLALAAAAPLAVCAAPEGLHSEPFGYPSALLDAPATLGAPAGGFVQIGRERLELGEAALGEAAHRRHLALLREGSGVFARDYTCLTGTEGGRELIVWLIATGSEALTEAQVEWVADGAEVPRSCARLAMTDLPVRLGKIGLGMTEKDVTDLIGAPSYSEGSGWKFWFSQRFLKNARGLQELELNWLGVRFEKGRAVRAFASLVKNP
ncbi:hypothetical protein [Sutterella sp.]|uniref:hypothetical protein n=1 Tax=Sutterella sp. TaxID=1981025 RepID=UPI0026DFA798|nr:hypothetical protein [Sutterella sp.]MDO5530637.1 hypothetical protein [Sutterella sp.]